MSHNAAFSYLMFLGGMCVGVGASMPSATLLVIGAILAGIGSVQIARGEKK